MIARSTKWLSDALYFMIILVVLAAVCISLTFCLKKRKWFKFNITATAFIGGFFLGNLLYALIFQTFGWRSYAGMLFVTASTACTMGLIFFLKSSGLGMIKLNIGLIAGIMSMRGLSLLCGAKGYPFEGVNWALLRYDQDLEYSGLVWVYLLVYLIAVGVYMCWMTKFHELNVHRQLGFYLEEQYGDGYRRAPKTTSDEEF